MLPYLRSKNGTTVYNLTSFGGLNNLVSHRTNELVSSLNTSSENYPALCSAGIPVKQKNLTHKGLGGGYFNKLYTLEHTNADSGSIYMCHDTKESAISDFSQRGDWVDIYAVGKDIPIRTLSGDTRTSDGTSYSAARVSAYAAQLLQAEPELTVKDLRQQILDNADTLPDGTKYI